MKKAFLVLGLITTSLVLNSCQWQSYTKMVFTHFSLTNESVRLVNGILTEQPISIVIRYESTDEHGEISNVILADGPLGDGELELNQSVTEPTEIFISMKVGEGGKTSEATAVLKPSNMIDFVLVHKIYPREDFYFLQFKGKNHRSLDLELRFSISGDLSQLKDFERELVQVSLLARPSVLDGRGETMTFNPVLVDDGKFSIEGDLVEPTLFTIEITEHIKYMFGEIEYLHAILEPGVNYRVVPLGKNGEYAVVADRKDSMHTQLVSSWQFDPVYVALVDNWMDRQINWQRERKARAEHKEQYVRNYQVDESCNHLNLTDTVKAEFVDPYPSLMGKASAELVKNRSASLREILRTTQDRELARMIFELSWIQIEEDEIISHRDTDEKIATLKELALKMDDSFVQQFITPQVDSLTHKKRLKARNSTLLPGHVAPSFTLTTVEGDTVSLSEVLSNNEMVLVDFWASWCGPCIASFPALKDMYAEYHDQGFEIITISIDDTLADWESAAAEQELPWIDLGDSEDGVMKGGSAPTASDYGVTWVPNKFLIDKEGCIVHKHFSEDELEKMLASRSVGSSS